MNEKLTSLTSLRSIPGLTTDWDFTPSQARRDLVWKRAYSPLIYSRRRPHSAVLKPIVAKPAWLVYFAFCPNDRSEPHHAFTLSRLKDMQLPVLIICASTSPATVPQELSRFADALYWKGLSGYDFSAYTLAVEAISAYSPDATIFVLNDSMFGPFCDLRPFLDSAKWDLTGFTASGSDENHIQSYAFILKEVTPSRRHQLAEVLYPKRAYNVVDPVIWCQETTMARIANRSMSVGAFLFSDGSMRDDPCLRLPFEMAAAGFPFIKRSLLGKMRKFQDPEKVRELLLASGHPL